MAGGKKSRREDDQYPEHRKLEALQGDNQKLGAFIEWLGENGFTIVKLLEECPDYPATDHDEEPEPHVLECDRCGDTPPFPSTVGVPRTPEEWIARYFDLDRVKLEREKQQMLASLRKEAECES